MGTLEKLGLIVLVFGAALHTWHYIPTLLLSVALMTAGGGSSSRGPTSPDG